MAPPPEPTVHRLSDAAWREWLEANHSRTTRAGRVDETARMASTNERANRWRPKKPGA
jgi:hypothetical protein